jgi:hypothetical protein
MLEVALVLAVAGALSLFALAAVALGAAALAAIGSAILLLGLAIGTPTGFWYHVVLYRMLAPRIALPPRWWWSPSDLHRHLTDAERRRIEPWYRIGGAGFVLCIAGGLAALAGLLASR